MQGRVVLRVLPRRSLLRAGLVSALVAGLPLFSVLYWLSASQGSWRRVLVVHVLAVTIGVFAWIRYHGAYLDVTADRLVKQGFFRLRVVERSAIASVVLSQTWRTGSSEAVPQLVVLDEDGVCIGRLRGAFWTRESMESVAEALQVPVHVEPDTISLREFYELHPGSAYWYEGRPWISAAGVAVAFAGAFVVMSWIMLAIGAPSAFSLTP